jgi:hypothetical protein
VIDLAVYELEQLPRGEPDPAPRQPVERTCEACGANVFRCPHDRRCPALAEVYRLTVDGDRQAQRLESLLEACNRRALTAWLRGGRVL